MKIRDKLFLGFGLYIFLAVVFGLFAYKDLRTISTHLLHVETSDDITNTLLEVRRYEKNYILFKDQASLDEIRKYLASLKTSISNLKSEIILNIGSDSVENMIRGVAEYERLLTLMGDNYLVQNELAEIVRHRGRAAERSLTGTSHEKFLELRRFEKNIMLYKDLESYQVFQKFFGQSHLAGNELVVDYEALVGKLHYLYQEEKLIIENMRKTAREIQTVTEKNANKERSDISTILKMSMILLFVALAVIMAVGTVINVKLAKSIVTPIQDLERITKKIARGDFSESIPVKGRDEIASLAESFNQMEDKLDQAMTALDEIIKKLQEKQSQLVEAEKLASIGKLAAGIAHEINNTLTSVLNYSSLMLEQCPPEDPRHDKLKLMARETDRARTIVRQLLNFGRESVIKPVKININQPVTEIAESLVAQEAFKGIELSLKLADGLPEVYADPAQIGQVVLNLLLNAIHAVTPPGRIDVVTRLGDKNIEILFADTGRGIPEENLHKIFDPFFSTKAASKGTGLGLAVSYGIIKKHGGDISVSSTVGKGTTFTVRLPIYG